MTTDVFPGAETEFGARVRRRLHHEKVIWLTTVGADTTPQPNPVWFIVEGDTVLVYNQPGARRLQHIRREPRVSLNLDGDGQGGDIVVLSGRAEVVDGQPLAHEVPAYLSKYQASAERISGDVESFSKQYGIAIRVTIDRVRGF